MIRRYHSTWPTTSRQFSWLFNSLAPGRSECGSKNVIFNIVLLIGIFRSSHDNALWWMPQDITDDKSTLVQVMAWCRQATSHYLTQCWLHSLWPYGVARPQWVTRHDRFLTACLLFVLIMWRLWYIKYHWMLTSGSWENCHFQWIMFSGFGEDTSPSVSKFVVGFGMLMRPALWNHTDW